MLKHTDNCLAGGVCNCAIELGNTKQEAFMVELKALLRKHLATINANDHWTGYPECGRDVRMVVEFDDWRVGEIDLGDFIGYED